jgi:hypothetical protein
MKVILAFLFAAAFPVLLMVLWYLYGQFQTFESSDPYIWVRTRNFAIICFIVSAGFVFLLGLPTYFVLRKFRLVRRWPTLLAGFSLAAIPMAIFTWPFKHLATKTSASVNGVQTMIDGVPTLVGWLQFVQGVMFLGVLGLLSAWAFWLVISNKRLW